MMAKAEARLEEYNAMLDVLKEAKLGSFLLIPMSYEEGKLDLKWLKENSVAIPMDTLDISETVKQTIGREKHVFTRYRLNRETVCRRLFGQADTACLYLCPKESSPGSSEHVFQLQEMELFIFHTQVAFLCIQIGYEQMKLLDNLVNLGYKDEKCLYYYADRDRQPRRFDFTIRTRELCALAGVTPFYPESPLFLEAYIYTVALTTRRFERRSTIRQAAFNLHAMVDLTQPVKDKAERDVQYVYAVKNQELGSYGWGCCVTSQTVSYIVASDSPDMDAQMEEQGQNGLPLMLLALYQRFTCLRFKELLARTDEADPRNLTSLKRQLLEFQAFGAIAPANISRWHNIRQIYAHILSANGVQEAIEDISTSLNLLAERQKERSDGRVNAIMGLITVFSILTIPGAVIELVDALSSGSLLFIITAAATLLTMLLLAIVVLIRLNSD